MNVMEELRARGLIAQSTDEKAVEAMLQKPTTFYIGFDPTADSLHVGHFLQMVIMRHLQRAGHRPIAVMGGGTGMIGDPSGKSDLRKMLTKESIAHNIACFEKQMSRFLDFSDGKALIVNNADWLLGLNYIDFIRDIGALFTVNRMLAAECFKIRYERGLTFLEFNYMILQAYDFLVLHEKYGCNLELGGDDQWSNILAGEDLIRRKTGDEAHGMTFTLLTTSDGRKMGKTEKGAVWLDPEKTPPYDFFQYWRNIEDASVIKTMKMLTFMELSEIAEYEKLSGAALNEAKERLAYELTALVHGKEEADKASAAAKALFSGKETAAEMPETKLSASEIPSEGICIIDLLCAASLAPSRGEARRLVEQGGVSVNDEKITDTRRTFSIQEMKQGLLVRKGKKVYHRISL